LFERRSKSFILKNKKDQKVVIFGFSLKKEKMGKIEIKRNWNGIE
jgi:hypothetical protein